MNQARGVHDFLQRCPARVIGITGTRGRSEAAAFAVRIFEEAGRRVWFGGGMAGYGFLPRVKASDMVVLDLPGPDLVEVDVSPHIAVCMAVTQDDASTRASLRTAIASMGNLFWHQHPEDLAIYDPRNDFSTQFAQLSPGEKIPFMRQPGAYISDGRLIAGDMVVCDLSERFDQARSIVAAVTAIWPILGPKPDPVRRAVWSLVGKRED